MSTAVVNAAVLSFTVLLVWLLLGLCFLVWVRVGRTIRHWLQRRPVPTTAYPKPDGDAS